MTQGTKAIADLLYMTPDAERHDKDALRRFILVCYGKQPRMRTAIGQAALDLLLEPMKADLNILMLEAAEKDLTRF